MRKCRSVVNIDVGAVGGGEGGVHGVGQADAFAPVCVCVCVCVAFGDSDGGAEVGGGGRYLEAAQGLVAFDEAGCCQGFAGAAAGGDEVVQFGEAHGRDDEVADLGERVPVRFVTGEFWVHQPVESVGVGDGDHRQPPIVPRVCSMYSSLRSGRERSGRSMSPIGPTG